MFFLKKRSLFLEKLMLSYRNSFFISKKAASIALQKEMLLSFSKLYWPERAKAGTAAPALLPDFVLIRDSACQRAP